MKSSRQSPRSTERSTLSKNGRTTVAAAGCDAVTVDEVVDLLKRAVRRSVDHPLVVRGELSRWKVASSGHCYGEIRGQECSLALAMFRRAARDLHAPPEIGTEVLVRCTPAVYPPRGQLQLVVQEVVATAEDGDWRWARAELLERLTAEGLLLQGRKRRLPQLPEHIGLVTSKSSAAFNDIVANLEGRAPWLRVSFAAAPVTGNHAGPAIASALERLNQEAVEVVLLARGGGDRHSLRAFDSEAVARAICDSRAPVVVAVGHAEDVSVADLVADESAATPTAAAERVTVGRVEIRGRLAAFRRSGTQTLSSIVDQQGGSLARYRGETRQRVRSRLRHIEEIVRSMTRDRLDKALHGSATRLEERVMGRRRQMDGQLRAGFRQCAERASRVEGPVLNRHVATVIRRFEQVVHAQGQNLDALSPSRILARGYSIVWDTGGQIVSDSNALAPGSSIRVRVGNGGFRAIVTDTEEAAP